MLGIKTELHSGTFKSHLEAYWNLLEQKCNEKKFRPIYLQRAENVQSFVIQLQNQANQGWYGIVQGSGDDEEKDKKEEEEQGGSARNSFWRSRTTKKNKREWTEKTPLGRKLKTSHHGSWLFMIFPLTQHGSGHLSQPVSERPSSSSSPLVPVATRTVDSTVLSSVCYSP